MAQPQAASWFLGNGAAQSHTGTGTFTGPMPIWCLKTRSE